MLVGDAKAGRSGIRQVLRPLPFRRPAISRACASKHPDPRALQNAWVGGPGCQPVRSAAGAAEAAADGNPVTVTMADGSKIEGKLVRRDDFLVILTLPDGTRQSMARHDGVPKVEVKDPNEAHKKMALELDDPENKNLHDVTAYLATLK